MTVDDLIRELIDNADGDIVTVTLAETLVKRLQDEHPDVLEAWLIERATAIIAAAMRGRLRNRRNAVRRKAAAFAEAADSDDLARIGEYVGAFATTYVVGRDISGSAIQRRVADMTGADHKYVSDAYQREGTHTLMLAAFHRRLSRVCGEKRTREVMTEDKYLEMYRSISTANGEAA